MIHIKHLNTVGWTPGGSITYCKETITILSTLHLCSRSYVFMISTAGFQYFIIKTGGNNGGHPSFKTY